MSTRSAAIVATSLTIAALFLRVGYVRTTVVEDPLHSDARQYVIYAYNLLENGVFSKSLDDGPTPDSFRSPGYPMLVAIALALAGDGEEGAKNAFYPFLLHLQAILGALMVPLTALLGVKFLPRWGALLAAGAVALSPHLVSLGGYVLTETLFGLLALSGILCFALALEKDTPLRFAAAGALLGGAHLTNETMLFVPALFAGAALLASAERFGSGGWKRRGRRIGLFLGAFCLFPLAWSLRNAISVPEGTRTSSDRAYATMTHGIYPGWVHEDPRFRYYAYREDDRAEEIRTSFSGFAHVLWERIKERPLRYASWFFMEKPYYGWSWSILQGQGDIYVYRVTKSLYFESQAADATRRLMKGLHPFFLLACCAGIPLCLARAFGRGREAALVETPVLLVLLVAYYTAIFAVFAPWPRYGVPLRPEFYLLGTWSLNEVGQALRKTRLRYLE